MKKPYFKPEIIFEDFSLSTNIAGDCELDTDLQGRGACGYKFGTISKVIFVSGNTGCNYTQVVSVNESSTDGEWNGTCYHNPTDENNLFNS